MDADALFHIHRIYRETVIVYACTFNLILIITPTLAHSTTYTLEEHWGAHRFTPRIHQWS